MLTRITAAEGAVMINNDDNVPFSGFTTNGVAKCGDQRHSINVQLYGIAQSLMWNDRVRTRYR